MKFLVPYSTMFDAGHQSLNSHLFPGKLIMTKFMSAYKNDDLFDKGNYHTVSLWAHTLKVFEISYFNQMNDYIAPYFSDFLTNFWINHCTKHHLTKITEIWKYFLDNRYHINIVLRGPIKGLWRTTTMVIMFWEFLIFYQIFLSPKAKRSLIISNQLLDTSCLKSCRTS